MWCKSCGSPLSSTAGGCAVCGQAVESASAGPPCASGLAMGGLDIRETEMRLVVHGSAPGGLLTTGDQQLFEVRGEGPSVWLGYVTWEDGEREIRRCRRYLSPDWHNRLLGCPRVELEAWGDGMLCVELGQARRDEILGIVTEDVSEYELDGRARACVRCALRSVGARAMGTRQELLGTNDARRHRLCVAFPESARLVPVVAFALTQIAPVLNRARAQSA